MTTEQKIAALASAILELAERCAHTWDYDGETMIGEGVNLESETETMLKKLANLLQYEFKP